MSVRDADVDRLLSVPSVPSVLCVEPALSARSRLSTAWMLPSARLACPPLPSSCTVNCSAWSTSSSRGHGPIQKCEKRHRHIALVNSNRTIRQPVIGWTHVGDGHKTPAYSFIGKMMVYSVHKEGGRDMNHAVLSTHQ